MKGRVISHYEIVNEIARGGMGVVYRARDLSLNRFVALKALPIFTSSDPIARQRFEREAQAASALNHPNIVTIYDLVSDEHASYIVMELIDGKTLGDVIPLSGLPPEQAIRYALQMTDALGSAHEAGIVHRDLKPQNVLVTRRDHVKILDFGVAKLKSEPSGQLATHDNLTRPGAFLGTTYYAAPEQFSGGEVDQRTDVYSLGVVLYQMLVGRVPFYADNPLELLQAIYHQQAKPLRHTHPHYPPIIDQIVARALHKQREGRYPSMDAFSEELVAAKEAFYKAKLESSSAGTQVSDAPSAVPLAVPQIGSSRSSYPPVWIEPPRAGHEKSSIAVLPFRSLSSDKDDEYMAMGIGSEISSALSRVPGIRVASNLSTFRYQGEGPDLQEIAAKLKIRYVLTGSLRRVGTRIRVMGELADALAGSVLWSRTYERHVEDLFAVQEEIAESIVRATGGELIRAGSEHADKASAHELDAWGLVRKAYHFWNYGFHPAGIGESLDLLRRAIQLDPAYASAYAFLALYLIERVVLVLTDRPEEDRAEANAAATKAVQLAPQDAEVLENAGLVWLHCAEYDQSVEALRRAVQIAPFNLVAWGYLGLALGWGGKDRDAREADKILTKLIAETPEHPSLPYWHYFLSGVYIRSSRFEDAVIHAQRSVELQPRFYIARITLANALGHLGRFEEGRAEIAHVLAMNPYVNEAVLHTEYMNIARDAEVADMHLAGLRAAKAFPTSNLGDQK